jgi:hypothetical protein
MKPMTNKRAEFFVVVKCPPCVDGTLKWYSLAQDFFQLETVAKA